MKKINVILTAIIALGLTFLIHSCTPPADYLENTVLLCKTLDNDAIKLSQLVARKDSNAIQEKYKENLSNIYNALETVQKEGSFRGNEDFYKATVDYINMYKDVYENDYPTLFNILWKEKKTYADGDTVAFIMDDITKKHEAVKATIQQEIGKFIKEYDLNVAN